MAPRGPLGLGEVVRANTKGTVDLADLLGQILPAALQSSSGNALPRRKP
jgi:hypothetical protein